MNAYDFVFSIIGDEKLSYENLDEKSKKGFSSFMINRIMSFDSEHTAEANEINKYLQNIPDSNLLKIFNILFSHSGRVNVKYDRNPVIKQYPDVIKTVKNYFEITPKEAQTYLSVLKIEQIKKILFEMGWTEKNIKKIL
jgi:hypothetical protein